MRRITPVLRLLLCPLVGLATACTGAARSDARLDDAMLAQVGGFGGCREIEQKHERHIKFFPQVRFYEGICVREHGDTVRPVVGVDERGGIFVLNAPSSFDFMRRAHPPTAIDSADLLEYARIALVFSGETGAQDSVVPSPSGLSDATLKRAGAQREQLRRSGVLRTLNRGSTIGVTMLGPSYLATYVVLVYPDDGTARVMQRERWPLNK